VIEIVGLEPQGDTPDAVDAIDPHTTVATEIRAKCSGVKWWSMPKIATTVQRAEVACREAMKRLEKEGFVTRHKTDQNEIEYQIGGEGEAKLRRALAAQNEELTSLRAQVAAQAIEIGRLKEQLAASSRRCCPASEQSSSLAG
jgi:predicted ArsR family transcriptional regulator